MSVAASGLRRFNDSYNASRHAHMSIFARRAESMIMQTLGKLHRRRGEHHSFVINRSCHGFISATAGACFNYSFSGIKRSAKTSHHYDRIPKQREHRA